MTTDDTNGPLHGLKVVEHARGVAAAYAGRLLAAMGAEVVMVEPPEGTPLRREPPFLDTEEEWSALFTYLAAGKDSVVADLASASGHATLTALLDAADIFIDDTPLAERDALRLGAATLAAAHPRLIHTSVLPFGATGPKAGWAGEEINLIHASGEGYLLPNGLTADLFPDRPPLKIAGHFAEMQGGVTAVFAALSALWAGGGAGATGGGRTVDVSVQDANVAIGAFAVQRYGDGSIEHRHERKFRYGGVIECADGYVELLTLEERQWDGLVELMGRPAWASDPAMASAAARSAAGETINAHIRAFAAGERAADLVARAQRLGVPMAPYNTPDGVLADPHVAARGLFAPVDVPGVGALTIQAAPFRFGPAPLAAPHGPPELGAATSRLAATATAAADARKVTA